MATYKIRASLLRRKRNAKSWTVKIATATPNAVRKVTIPMPRSLFAALVCVGVIPRPPPPAVLVGSSEVVSEALRLSEAEIAEEIKELTMELVTDAAVPVAESVADPEASASVDDMAGMRSSTKSNLWTEGE
jgi:hypothetical protein